MVGASAMLFVVFLDEKTGTPKFHSPVTAMCAWDQRGSAHGLPSQACSYTARAFLPAQVTLNNFSLTSFHRTGKDTYS